MQSIHRKPANGVYPEAAGMAQATRCATPGYYRQSLRDAMPPGDQPVPEGRTNRAQSFTLGHYAAIKRRTGF
jgi:hypothetical protein